jgi:threonine 3-dehydrogenase
MTELKSPAGRDGARRSLVLVTGACGEIGQALVQGLSQKGGYRIVTSDLAPLPDSIKNVSSEHVQGDLVYKIKNFYDYDFDEIFHLAASLSSKAEVSSEEAHRINVEGTMQLLMLAAYRSEKYHKSVKFLFPSSIAAYGMSDVETKRANGCVKEDDFNTPHTMYGCNKLYCEKLGIYYSKYFGQKHLDDVPPHMLDFRAIRFPGLISAFTLPSSGTSDYGPEMLHALRLFRARRYQDLVHGNARRDQIAVDAGGCTAREVEPWGL